MRLSVYVAAVMVAASVLAHSLTPTQKLSELLFRESLNTLVPMRIGDWVGTPATNIVVADPKVAATLSRIYTETLSRTYVDSRGRSVMLSIAYGDDQRDGMEVHYPEVCYPAQGFEARSARIGKLKTPIGEIRVKHLQMKLGQRVESVTYWTMIGNAQTLGGIDKKINEMRYRIDGLIPDGLLFRVSSINRDMEVAYEDHADFVSDMVKSINRSAQIRLTGIGNIERIVK